MYDKPFCAIDAFDFLVHFVELIAPMNLHRIAVAFLIDVPWLLFAYTDLLNAGLFRGTTARARDGCRLSNLLTGTV